MSVVSNYLTIDRQMIDVIHVTRQLYFLMTVNLINKTIKIIKIN
jgi:hypothetical protein